MEISAAQKRRRETGSEDEEPEAKQATSAKMTSFTRFGKYVIANKRCSRARLQEHLPNSAIVDVTSKGTLPFLQLSPFYPHGGICYKDVTSSSVEGLWQGLKVFQKRGVDQSKFHITTMKNLKRSQRGNGRVRGHQPGLVCGSSSLLDYVSARREIYLPAYRSVLENKASAALAELRQLASEHDQVILLDFTTNGDVEDTSRPLSHAALVAQFLTGQWPDSVAETLYQSLSNT